MWRYVTTFTWLKQLTSSLLPQSIRWLSFLVLWPFSYSKHTTLQFFTLQSYVFALIFVLQVLVYVLLGQQKKKKKKVLLREKSEPSLYTWHSAQETQSSSLKFKFQVALPPTRIITATGIQIVLCCTWTIHKGYYIVLHSFPFLQLSLVYVQVHFIFIFFSSTGVQNHF